MNFTKIAAICFILIMFATASAERRAAADENQAGSADSALTVPDFELQDLNGTSVTLSQFKGQKPVLLYFWATWCRVCMGIRPEVVKLRQEIPSADMEILAINVGHRESLAKVKRFEQADPAPYTVLYDTDSKVTRSYRIEGVPHFVLVDKSGAVKYQGNALPSDLMRLLKTNQSK